MERERTLSRPVKSVRREPGTETITSLFLKSCIRTQGLGMRPAYNTGVDINVGCLLCSSGSVCDSDTEKQRYTVLGERERERERLEFSSGLYYCMQLVCCSSLWAGWLSGNIIWLEGLGFDCQNFSQPLSLRITITIACIVGCSPLQGLAYLHERNKMHRDIKVMNCMVLWLFKSVHWTKGNVVNFSRY